MIGKSITQATRCILDGGVIAYPTEAIYGLGCLPHNEEAVRRILDLKQRPETKGLILVASEISQLTEWIAPLKEQQLQTIISPRPSTTWIVNANDHAPRYITGGTGQVAIRISQHRTIQNLCNSTGTALVSTSANPHSLTPALSAKGVQEYFPTALCYILDTPLGAAKKASTIIELNSGNIIRH